MQKKNLTIQHFTKRYLYVLIGLMIICWSFAFPFIKIGLEELNPINLTILRLFIACVVFFLIYGIFQKKFSKIYKNDILPLFFLGFFGIIVYHLGLNYGEQYISASAASLIIATIPIFIVIFATVFLKERITIKILLGVILSLLGVVIISLAGTLESSIKIIYLSGAFAVLIAAIVGAFYTIAGKKMLQRYSALSLTTYAILIGSLGLIPFIRLSFFEEVAALSSFGWFAVLFLGIFSTVIAYLLWYVALEIKSASELSVFLYFIPVLATTFSYTFFHEQITLMFVLGGALVIVGLYIVNKQNNSKK
jgi:drug/metabolite transporter (DMT)-like permease